MVSESWPPPLWFLANLPIFLADYFPASFATKASCSGEAIPW
jgi:hypothetical protein